MIFFDVWYEIHGIKTEEDLAFRNPEARCSVTAQNIYPCRLQNSQEKVQKNVSANLENFAILSTISVQRCRVQRNCEFDLCRVSKDKLGAKLPLFRTLTLPLDTLAGVPRNHSDGTTFIITTFFSQVKTSNSKSPQTLTKNGTFFQPNSNNLKRDNVAHELTVDWYSYLYFFLKRQTS